jgi:twinkle protein
MGTIVKRNQPCLNPKCGSSDARQIYEKGDSTCFSCNTRFPASAEHKMANTIDPEDNDDFVAVEGTVEETSDNQEEKQGLPAADYSAKLAEIREYPVRGFMERNIKKIVCEEYGVRVSYGADGLIDQHYYPYHNDDGGGYKVRTVVGKKFSYIGKAGGLFGRNLFSPGKRVIITEGEIDTLTLAQAYYDKYQKFYPVISMPSASGTAQLLANRDWLRSFDEVVLCFDNDEAGKAATEKAIKIIGFDKVKVVNLGNYKDPSEMFLAVGGQELLTKIYDAESVRPAGIIGKVALKAQMHALAEAISVAYPACLSGIQSKLKGMRLAEIALYISGTGSGKSTILRENILHLLATTKDSIGVISLEETPGETARNMSMMALNKNRANGSIPTSELDIGFDSVFGDDRVIVLDHQGSIKDASIVDQLEYMALMGCKYLFIDHITILVSEGAEGLTGNEAIDKIMNDLLRIAKKHNVHIGLVSHLRKTITGGISFEEGRLPSVDDIRGSGSIKQISMDIIAFARNMNHADERVRNHILMAVLKCRETGLTGPVPGAYFNPETGRLLGPEHIPPQPDSDDEFHKI